MNWLSFGIGLSVGILMGSLLFGIPLLQLIDLYEELKRRKGGNK